jgi:hypothetical protein
MNAREGEETVYKIWRNGCLDETVYRIWHSNGCLDETIIYVQ